MSQLKRDDWLENGLMLIAQKGVDSLTIDAMCSQLGVTKGSFYHHFKNRKVYLRAILEFWEEKYTSQFVNISQKGATTTQQLELLNEQVVASFSTNEVHIRAWAQSDPLAREFQARVDQRRINYLYQLYKQWTDDDQKAMGLAHLVYTTLIGSTSIIPALKREDYQNIIQIIRELVQTLIQENEP